MVTCDVSIHYFELVTLVIYDCEGYSNMLLYPYISVKDGNMLLDPYMIVKDCNKLLYPYMIVKDGNMFWHLIYWQGELIHI